MPVMTMTAPGRLLTAMVTALEAAPYLVAWTSPQRKIAAGPDPTAM
jgi:hypothetical protein